MFFFSFTGITVMVPPKKSWLYLGSTGGFFFFDRWLTLPDVHWMWVFISLIQTTTHACNRT